ncbi:hypothetical protein F4781DRAFT_282319 [Annulohypoxylon bovei var. microspora]|nr:hypothetical protein F4781DRAFT_282319 [Annulohypoxylon bovei var. microspora]
MLHTEGLLFFFAFFSRLARPGRGGLRISNSMGPYSWLLTYVFNCFPIVPCIVPCRSVSSLTEAVVNPLIHILIIRTRLVPVPRKILPVSGHC